MKKIFGFALILCLLFSMPAAAEKLDEEKINSVFGIGGLKCTAVSESDEYISLKYYIVDSEMNVIAGPFDGIADNGGFAYCTKEDGTEVMYDKDGTVLKEINGNGTILPPYNGIFGVMNDTSDFELCSDFDIYDYNTKQKISHFDRGIMYYLETQTEKMFIEKGGKYALVDKNGNFITDYIYDGVEKRFNIYGYQTYAVVIQDGKEKYIDWELNEINLDPGIEKPFITYRNHMTGVGGDYYKKFYYVECGDKTSIYDEDSNTYLFPFENSRKYIFMTDKYIIASDGNTPAKYGIVDYDGNTAVPFDYQYMSLDEQGNVEFFINDNGVNREGVISLSDLSISYPVNEKMGYFYQYLGIQKPDEILSAVVVYSNGTYSEITSEDLKRFNEVYFNALYERVISPKESAVSEGYIKLYGEDGKSWDVYADGSVIVGFYGGEDEVLCYMPCIGNSRNALYTMMTELKRKYEENARTVTDYQKPTIPQNDLLNTDGASLWAVPEIKGAANKNLLSVNNVSFYYDNPITREDFCNLAASLTGTYYYPSRNSRGCYLAVKEIIQSSEELAEKYKNTKFTDVTEEYNEHIISLSALGFVKGYENGSFLPDAKITREEAAVILTRMADYFGVKYEKNEYKFNDLKDVSDWAKESVWAVKNMGIMNGDDKEKFNPKDPYTVEETIATMYRLFKLIKD